MNNTPADGAVRDKCPPLTRRVFSLMFLVVVLLSFCVGEVFSPVPARADPARVDPARVDPVRSAAKTVTAPAMKNSPSRKASSKTAVAPKRRRQAYARSLLPPADRQALKERGISSGFGKRAISRKKTRMHKGIDVPGPKGSKVIAYNNGTVIFVGARNGYGKTVVIRQLDGRDALYAHLSNYAVSVGDKLKRGSYIGFIGRTGRATGYHLHFEIIDEGENLDPALHVWHGSELVLAPGDLDPETASRTGVAESNTRRAPASL